MSGGFLSSGEKRTPEQIAQIEAANRMEPIEFTTPSGSQGVTNENYAKYTDSYPDLLSNYNSNWRDKGVSKSEFGAMHWMQSGKGEGRSMPGISSPSAPAESFGGASVATPTASPSPSKPPPLPPSKPPPPMGLVGIILPPTPLVRAKSPKDILGSVA